MKKQQEEEEIKIFEIYSSRDVDRDTLDLYNKDNNWYWGREKIIRGHRGLFSKISILGEVNDPGLIVEEVDGESHYLLSDGSIVGLKEKRDLTLPSRHLRGVTLGVNYKGQCISVNIEGKGIIENLLNAIRQELAERKTRKALRKLAGEIVPRGVVIKYEDYPILEEAGLGPRYTSDNMYLLTGPKGDNLVKFYIEQDKGEELMELVHNRTNPDFVSPGGIKFWKIVTSVFTAVTAYELPDGTFHIRKDHFLPGMEESTRLVKGSNPESGYDLLNREFACSGVYGFVVEIDGVMYDEYEIHLDYEEMREFLKTVMAYSEKRDQLATYNIWSCSSPGYRDKTI